MTAIERYKTYYRLFREVSGVVHSKSDINEVLELVVSRIVQGTDANGGILCVMDKEVAVSYTHLRAHET